MAKLDELRCRETERVEELVVGPIKTKERRRGAGAGAFPLSGSVWRVC